MKQITMTVVEAKAFLAELDCVLETVALSEAMQTGSLTDRDARSLAEIIREQVLLFEELRIEAGRKSKTAAPTEPGA